MTQTLEFYQLLIKNIELTLWSLFKPRSEPISSLNINYDSYTPKDFIVSDIKSKDKFGPFDFDFEYYWAWKTFILTKRWVNYLDEDQPNFVRYIPNCQNNQIIELRWEVPLNSTTRSRPLGRTTGPALISYDLNDNKIIETKWQIGEINSETNKQFQKWLNDNVPDKNIFELSEELKLLFKLQFN